LYLEGGTPVNFITKALIGAREWRRAQTTTEYALILGAVAAVVFVTYGTMAVYMGSGPTWRALRLALLYGT
jgi:hypothetical protein